MAEQTVRVVREFDGYVEIEPKGGIRCKCKRNLDFPAEVTDYFIICRCGRRNQIRSYLKKIAKLAEGGRL